VTRWLSIGAKWTLRYTAVMLLAVSLLAAYTYWRIDDRFEREARFLIDLQLKEVVEAVGSSHADDPAVRAMIEGSAEVAGPDLKLGLEVWDAQGRRRYAVGSLQDFPVGLPKDLPKGEEGRSIRILSFPSDEKYPYLVVTRRLPDGGSVQGAIYLRRFVRNARSVRDIYLWTLPVAVIFTLALGSWLVRGSLRPIASITRAARRISGTHLEEEVPRTGSGDELDELARTLNEMMDRIRGSMERMQRFSANAAHELRTPLNALRSRLDVTLEQERTQDEYRKALAETADEVATLSESVHAMLRLSQSEAGLRPEHRIAVQVGAIARDVVEFFEPLAAEQGLSLGLGRCADATLAGEPAWLRQCFANLIDNAIRYTPEGGSIQLDVDLDADGAAVEVRVSDTGIGIDPEERERIFEPYHRVRGANGRTGPGAGIGLALAREIARAHGGDLTVESEPGRGSTFRVRIPLA
jgi:heavy metal sensor kinase